MPISLSKLDHARNALWQLFWALYALKEFALDERSAFRLDDGFEPSIQLFLSDLSQQLLRQQETTKQHTAARLVDDFLAASGAAGRLFAADEVREPLISTACTVLPPGAGARLSPVYWLLERSVRVAEQVDPTAKGRPLHLARWGPIREELRQSYWLPAGELAAGLDLALAKAGERSRACSSGNGPQYVTLNQMAAICMKSKRTLENRKARKRNPLPAPGIEGGGGRADEWEWSEIRPWLEKEFRRKLPEVYPNQYFQPN